MCEPYHLLNSIKHAHLSRHLLALLVFLSLNSLLEAVVRVISRMHDAQLMKVHPRHVIGHLHVRHLLRLAHHLPGYLCDHAADRLCQEQPNVLHVPSYWFLLFLDFHLCKVIVGVYVCRALAELLLPCDEVLVAFHDVSCHLQVHYAVLTLHC